MKCQHEQVKGNKSEGENEGNEDYRNSDDKVETVSEHCRTRLRRYTGWPPPGAAATAGEAEGTLVVGASLR